MKAALTSFDIHFLVRELHAVVGSRLDKVYQGVAERKRDLTFQLHQKNRGKKLLRVLLPSFLFLAEQKPSYELMPGPFASFLRKYVGNGRLIEVRQRGFERIIEFVLENKDGTFVLILEFLPPGNALLLNPQGKIINLLEPQRFSQRVLRGGVIYQAPDPQFNTKEATPEQIAERLFTSNKDSIVKAIAMDLGFGGEYAEEICVRAEVEKSRSDLTKEELARVAATVKALFDEPPSPFVTADETFPFAMKTKRAVTEFISFSAAIASIVPDIVAKKRDVVVKQKKAKGEDIVTQQEAALKGFLKTAEENQRKGELLYEHYHEVDALLKEIHALHKANGWSETKKILKERGVVVDEQKGEVTVELE